MAVRPLQTLGAPCLRVVATEVPQEMFGSPQMQALVTDLVGTMRAANGAGIAAPQIGEPWRVFVVHGTGSNPRYPYKPAIPLTVFVNPTIEILDPTPMHMIEGCLSVPGFRGRVQRACKVRCRAQHLDGSWFTIKAEGHAAGTLQHELDHLDAKLFPDLAGPAGLMTSQSFEIHAKEDFFAYAADININYPVPLVWEEGEPMSGTQVENMLRPAHESESNTVSYAAELTWTGAAFERGIQVHVCNRTGKVASIEAFPEGGTSATCRSSACEVIELPGRALMPGFVNAHSHAFQRGLRGRGEMYPRAGPPGNESATPSFWSWRDGFGLNTTQSKCRVLPFMHSRFCVGEIQ